MNKAQSQPGIPGLELFLELVKTCNLSDAAANADISLATASRMLDGLRSHFNDPLFIRCKEGMRPTPYAIEMAAPVKDVLMSYYRLAKPQELRIGEVVKEVRIGCVDNAPFSLVPRLPQMLRAKAPGVTLVFKPIDSDRFEMLRRQELDMVISPVSTLPATGFHTLDLGMNEYVVGASPDHPLAARQKDGPLADEDLLPYDFIDILLSSSRSGEAILRDMVFPTLSACRSVVRTYYFLPFLRTISDSDFLMVIPKRTAEHYKRYGMVEILDLKTRGMCNIPRLIWHDVTHADPFMQWLRATILVHSQSVGSDLPAG
ncbi:MAG: LysR family transcriptional regulator [Duodenibacillus sp.]|nr:LysR family transcriptional regulator [Duodenibacillus sp.]